MTILKLVRRARRRFAVNEVLGQGAVALGAALAFFVLLLILGTQILDWPWLVAAPAAALVAGVYQVYRRMPSDYGMAQRIDRVLGLSDTLSTALYYLKPAERAPGSEGMRGAQLAAAEALAAGVAVEQAVPFHMPRAIYAVAALGLLASALFALRYGFSRELDLRVPLTHVIQDAMGWNSASERAAKPKKQALPPEMEDAFGLNLPDGDRDSGQLDAASDESLETVGVPETDPEKYGGEQAKGQPAPGPEEEGADASDEAQASSGAEAPGEGDQSDAQGKQANQGKQAAGNKSGENSSLMAKLKEAMQNLMAKMRQQNQSGSEQSTQSPNGQQQAKTQQGKGGQKSGKSQGAQQQGQSEGSDDGEAGEDAELAQNPQGKGAGQSPDNSNSKQPGSGIGKQDGNKDAKEAEQLAAMGKISEIIGKRSANVSGEITVEVQNSSQQLRTPYAASAAQHGEAAGEINRDEVPVIYQTFVQQYFEEVRKQPAGGSVRPAPAEPAGTPPVFEARRPVPLTRPSGQ
jgi:hypothetical protein